MVLARLDHDRAQAPQRLVDVLLSKQAERCAHVRRLRAIGEEDGAGERKDA
jgi:hypothetical protein